MTVPLSNLKATWTSTGSTYNAISMNVTTGGQNDASNLLILKTNGVSQLSVSYKGNVVTDRINTNTANVATVNAQTVTTDTLIVGSQTITGTSLFNGVSSFGDGTASAPSIAHTGDLNTGIYFPTSDNIAFTTAGTIRASLTTTYFALDTSVLYVDFTNNRVGVGTQTPTVALDVTGAITSSGIVTGTQFKSTIGDGTAPFTVTSTTKVTNLNADFLDGYPSSTSATASSVAVRDSNGALTASNFLVSGTAVLTSLVPAACTSFNGTVNSDTYGLYSVSSLSTAMTIGVDGGTPANGEKMIIRIKDNGTTRAITFTTGQTKGFRSIGISAIVSGVYNTVASKWVYFGCVYNTVDSRWDIVAFSEEV